MFSAKTPKMGGFGGSRITTGSSTRYGRQVLEERRKEREEAKGKPPY